MEWIREPMEVNMPKSVSWCPCMGAKCRGNNPPFCSIKTSNCKSVQTERLKQALQKAEAVIIGAGAGLSTSAGFTYSGTGNTTVAELPIRFASLHSSSSESVQPLFWELPVTNVEELLLRLEALSS